MGWENISIEYLSAFLKQHNHKVSLAYEQSLFDDKNYLCIPLFEKLFRQEGNIIKQIIDTKPDLVAFSLMTVTYRWGLEIAKEVKKYLNVPIIFGGIHAISVPEKVIQERCVDIVCVGEGEYPLLDLCNSIEKGTMNYSIEGLWFKKNGGEIIKNPKRKPIENIDELPMPDKDLFAEVVPIKNYYLAVTNRGCPYACTFCSVSYEGKENIKVGGKSFRERSVDKVIEELKTNLGKYHYKWVDFRNSVLSASTDWTLEFCNKYKKEINKPFRIFSHPLLINEKVAIALRDAGCFAVQLGLESYDEHVRKNILNRRETNEQIHRALDILERHNVTYSLDYILGLPGQTEEELLNAAKLFSRLKYCYRISPFMIQYLPKLDLIKYGLDYNHLSSGDIKDIENGFHGNYMADGSIGRDKERLKLFNTYKIFFRLMSFMPLWMRSFFVRTKLFKIFHYLPLRPVLSVMDLSMVFRDYDARAYAQNYVWWFLKRFNKSHKAYYKNKINGHAQAL